MCTTSDCLPENWEQETQTNEIQTNENKTEINDILKNIVIEQNQCWGDNKLFVDIAIL
jgi:hypothetical protein